MAIPPSPRLFAKRKLDTPEGKQSFSDPTLEKLSYFLDNVFRIPGTNLRFGLDPIIGLLFPGAGDVVSNLISAYIVWRSVRYGIPKVVVARMVFNVGLDYVLGSIPLIGDLFDFGFKANQKNISLLNRFASANKTPSWTDWAWAALLIGGLLMLGVLCILGVIFLLHWAGFRWM